MNRNVALALLFLAGLGIGLARLYPARELHESTPAGLRELMLSSIQNDRLDLTRLRLAAPWERLCHLPAGTSDEAALQKLPFLPRGFTLSSWSGVAHDPVTAVLLFGAAAEEPVAIADLPTSRVRFEALEGACVPRDHARFPAR